MRLATDYTHFYAMVTAIIAGDLLDKYPDEVLTKKLVAFARAIEGGPIPKDKKMTNTMKDYMTLSSKRTTDTARRKERQRLFIQAIDGL